MKLTNEELNRLRGISLQRVLGMREGRAVNIKCPFHNDRTPSMTIYPNDRGFYCHGCKAKGNTIDFLVLSGMTFEEAVDELIKFVS